MKNTNNLCEIEFDGKTVTVRGIATYDKEILSAIVKTICVLYLDLESFDQANLTIREDEKDDDCFHYDITITPFN